MLIASANSDTAWSYTEMTTMSPVGTASSVAPQELCGSITAATSKDLLIGLSAEVELMTYTEAKGTNKGNKDTSVAEAGLEVEVRFLKTNDFTALGTAAAVCDADLNNASLGVHCAVPGPVTFASRVQELTVETNLDIQAAAETCDNHWVDT